MNNNRIGLKDISGKETRYRYDDFDRISKITDNDHELVDYQYNPDGTLKKMVTGGNSVTEYSYDIERNLIAQRTYVENSWERGKGFEADSLSDQKLISFEVMKQGMANKSGHINLSLGTMYGNSSVIVNNTYAYDAMGNMTTKKTLAGLTEYTYDSLERVTKVLTPKSVTEYAYDNAGNRISKAVMNIINQKQKQEHYIYDARNRMLERNVFTEVDHILKQKEMHEYTYDEQGNMTVARQHKYDDGKRELQSTKTFQFDALNRLQEVRSDKTVLQRNTYDAEGLRTEMEENNQLVQFLFDGDKVIPESDTSKGLQRFIRGYDLVSSDSEEARSYYHYASDNLGSITDVINYQGQVLNHYEYDTFGEYEVKEEQVDNRFGFTGEQFDPATNLYYLRARFYNPMIARFIQEDNFYGDGLNLYAYCHNNPVRYVDPTGHAVYDPSTNKYPPRTKRAQRECKTVTAVMNSVKGKSEFPVVSVYTHENHTVSVGFCGDYERPSFQNAAQKLQNKLDEITPGKYTVALETDQELITNMKKSGKEIRGNNIGMCAEPKAASAAHRNESPISGMDTRNRKTENHGHPYTGPNKTSDSQMDPCPTCKDFEIEYTEFANSTPHSKGG